ncbi:MAG TPA: 1-(5-phosphoribosyl)-5-[(5-phosphoribosylamino)methylideneamino]imidazole-4-carboxamide isomerase [Candidatus Omnitrophota bacterium]|nr:1-(5-phosphoribosyl)-5-[(5-phosphoribosylamino)methylideneamino]imidazole-4-carboxamide isomerase [Candidatus Omnitrophota bacterium]
MFEVIPAIDILDGKCVRLKQGKFTEKTIYFEDPIEAAKLWESKGATRIHVVDLNGARTGTPENTEIIKNIIKTVKVPVQAGGGLRRIDLIEEMVKVGVDRVVLGTSAIFNHNLLSQVCEKFDDKIAVAVDAKDDKVVANGWTNVSSKNVFVLAQEAVTLGVQRFIYTDISRDGMLKGPNFAAIQKFISSVDVPVIASGGVSSKEDIDKLRELRVEGCILGQALYTGAVKLEEVL